jgi:hypothetical protein
MIYTMLYIGMTKYTAAHRSKQDAYLASKEDADWTIIQFLYRLAEAEGVPVKLVPIVSFPVEDEIEVSPYVCCLQVTLELYEC